jgi:hypothetical protein
VPAESLTGGPAKACPAATLHAHDDAGKDLAVAVLVSRYYSNKQQQQEQDLTTGHNKKNSKRRARSLA